MDQGSAIAAIATPPGRGAIALLRLSGINCLAICDKIFLPADNGLPVSERPASTIHYGKIVDKGQMIDEVLISIFRAPRSYTGEDLVEISCHGSVYIQQKILELLLNHGAGLAKPGEFTQRAYLNGKMDLSQAEAVADLIESESEEFHKVVIQQMRGEFSQEITSLRSRLLEFISLIELELDFSEEDVEFANRDKLKFLLSKLSLRLESLTNSFAFGNALKNGIPVVIAGKPNVGKSTLLNLLLMEEKALVSEIPGTTRDSIEDVIHIDGISFRFIDTAGIRETSDRIEIMGIRRTMEKIRLSTVVLLMADASDPTEQINHLLEELRKKQEFKDKTIILLLNKSDLVPGTRNLITGSADITGSSAKTGIGWRKQLSGKLLKSIARKDHFPSLKESDYVLGISAKTKSGLEEMKTILLNIVKQSKSGNRDLVVTNIRHYNALKKAHEAVVRASSGLENQLSGDLLAMDIREVLHYLGEITGEITTDEILGNIFKNFCIGK